MRIAFVVQRYGLDVHGGSEALCRAWAEHLAARHQVTVFTTCARDYLTWADHYPPGSEELNGVIVRRFPVDAPRDLDTFNEFTHQVYANRGDLALGEEWMRRQGPYSTPLFEAIVAERDDFARFVFMTYLYATAYFGLPLVADKALLAPTAHDEPPIYLGIFRQLFALPQGFLFLMPSEELLVRRLFPTEHIPGYEVGLEVPLDPEPQAEPLNDLPELLYIGRVHPSKNVDQLAADFARYREEGGKPARLLVAGRVDTPMPEHPDIAYLGYVDEARKRELLRRCALLVLPSIYESLSIVLLEAWAHGRPTLVNGAAPVLREQTLRGGGGLFYHGYAEFVVALDTLLADRSLRAALGGQGRAFVARRYTWTAVDTTLERALNA